MSAELEKGLRTLLTGTVKVHPRVPQRPTFPLARFQRVYTTRTNAVDGENVGVTEVGIQLDIMSDSYSEAKATADSVRAVLHGYSGAWGTLTARFVHLETETDAYEQDGDNVTHWVTQRYRIWTNMD